MDSGSWIILGLVLWCAIISGALGYLSVHYQNFRYSVYLDKHKEGLKKKTHIIPGLGVFTTRKKIKPTINDDHAAYLAEQEKEKR